jgi:predicted kinase
MTEIRNQMVVVVAGPPGSGKSTVAAAVARALGAALIDIDVTFAPIVPLFGEHPRSVLREAIYAGLTDTAVAAAQTGVHVVVAAPFTRERRDARAWGELRDRLAEAGAQAHLVWLRVPDATLLERLAARGAGRDASKLANPADWLREASPGTPPSVPHIELDGTPAADVAACALLAELASLGENCRPMTREACSS